MPRRHPAATVGYDGGHEGLSRPAVTCPPCAPDKLARPDLRLEVTAAASEESSALSSPTSCAAAHTHNGPEGYAHTSPMPRHELPCAARAGGSKQGRARAHAHASTAGAASGPLVIAAQRPPCWRERVR